MEEVASDAAAARHLAAARDRDLADLGVKVDANRSAINALGQQTAGRFDRLEHEMRTGVRRDARQARPDRSRAAADRRPPDHFHQRTGRPVTRGPPARLGSSFGRCRWVPVAFGLVNDAAPAAPQSATDPGPGTVHLTATVGIDQLVAAPLRVGEAEHPWVVARSRTSRGCLVDRAISPSSTQSLHQTRGGSR